MQNSVRWMMVALATLLVSACGGRQAPEADDLGDGRHNEIAIVEYDFDAVVIRAGTDEGGEMWSNITELDDLFAEANDYLRAEDYLNALDLYEIVLENHSDDSYLRATHYNLGLVYEGLQEWFNAALHYQEVLNGWMSSDDALFAFFRLAECVAQLGEYAEIPALMDRVLERSDLHHIDRLEAHLRWANALLELREFAEAEEHYNTVLALNESAMAVWDPESMDESDEPVELHDPIIAQSYYGRARVYHSLFLEIHLVLPEDQLTRDLVDKSQLFDQAQASYLDCVRTGHPYWAPAAGYMVGQLYEDFYYDILATEVPIDFGDLEHEIYFEELRAFIAPALERALSVYEHNLAMAYRLGSSNLWVDSTLDRIYRLQTYLGDPTEWEDEHDLVIERRHPRSAFYTDGMEFRSDR